MNWFTKLWQWQQRRMDVQLLWPECIAAARGDRDKAKDAFLLHANIDPAYRYMTAKEMQRFMENLP